MRGLFFILFALMVPDVAAAACPAVVHGDAALDATPQSVADSRPMRGLASMYNQVGIFGLDEGGAWRGIAAGDTLNGTCLIAAVGRFRTMLIEPGGAALDADGVILLKPNAAPVIVPGTALDGAVLGPLRYPHLWWPLYPLARGIEAVLTGIQGLLGISWGIAILLLAILLRLLLMPVSRYTKRAQQRVSRLESQLQPRVAGIRREQRGEAAHMATLEVYKDLGISPYFRLRPMAGALIQVPLLVAIFNVLGGIPQLHGASFLWISDLSLPDRVGQLPFAIPMLGQQISPLPLLMTGCAIIAGRTYRNPDATPAMQRSQRRNIYFLAAVFLLLFYPFPAAMVWFWLATNLLQLGQQLIGHARDK